MYYKFQTSLIRILSTGLEYISNHLESIYYATMWMI